MANLDASAVLARLERVVVSPDLLRDVALAHADAAARGSRETLSSLILGCVTASQVSGNRADIALATKIRLLSLASLVRAHVLDEWVKAEDLNGLVLFHSSLFRAAATEPLILVSNGDIGSTP